MEEEWKVERERSRSRKAVRRKGREECGERGGELKKLEENRFE